MTAFLIAGATVLLLASMSILAARRVAPGAERLTMQWNWNGKPNWSLPRTAALSLTPAFGAVLLAVVGSMPDGRAGLPIVCAALLAVHALHLVLLARRG